MPPPSQHPKAGIFLQKVLRHPSFQLGFHQRLFLGPKALPWFRPHLTSPAAELIPAVFSGSLIQWAVPHCPSPSHSCPFPSPHRFCTREIPALQKRSSCWNNHICAELIPVLKSLASIKQRQPSSVPSAH